MSDEKQKSKKRKLKEIEEEKIEEDDLIDEKCPVMRDLCKSKVNWVLFRKRIFQRLRNDVKNLKLKTGPIILQVGLPLQMMNIMILDLMILLKS